MSFEGLAIDEERQIEEFLRHAIIVPLNDDVERAAIRLRRREHLKLPDAIIAATALVTDSTLITNDHKLMRLQGSGLKVLTPV
jgi:predicted nucleic acid-binding protein